MTEIENSKKINNEIFNEFKSSIDNFDKDFSSTELCKILLKIFIKKYPKLNTGNFIDIISKHLNVETDVFIKELYKLLCIYVILLANKKEIIKENNDQIILAYKKQWNIIVDKI